MHHPVGKGSVAGMLSVKKIYAGHGAAEYYLAQERRGLADYYLPETLSPGEAGDAPPVRGRVAPGSAWWGGGAASLEVEGGITREVFQPLYGAGIGPDGSAVGTRFRLPEDARATAVTRAANIALIADPEERWRKEQELARTMPRPSVAAWDCTFSPVKSVSLLWAGGDDLVQRLVWDSHIEAVDAGLDYLERHGAHVRAGRGGVRTHDTTGLVVARMNEYTSRDGDMQLHTHCVVLNRAETQDDGTWRALDGRSLLSARHGAGALYARTLEAGLTRRLGVAWRDRPDGLREIAGVDDELIDRFSSRRRAITERVGEMTRAFEERHGVAPPAAVVRSMAQTATLATRRGKNEIPPEVAVAAWETHAARIGQELAAVPDAVARAARRASTSTAGGVDPVEAVTRRLSEEGRTTFSRHEVLRAALDVVPVGTRSPIELERSARDLVTRTLASLDVIELTAPGPYVAPQSQRRGSDGAPVYERANRRRWTLKVTLDREAWLLQVANKDRTAPSLSTGPIDRAAGSTGLSTDQRRAVHALLSTPDRLSMLVGPAGSGKTRALAAAVEAWEAGGHEVVGLTVSQAAAEVLAAETGARCENLSKWLFETNAGRWSLPTGALVLVDEASMVETERMVAVVDQVRRAGGRVVLVGDPAQLSAIGTSGAFELLIDRAGATELTEVRRFANDWERDASLRLRAGDVTVIDEYNRHGRIRGGRREEIERQVLEAWWQDRGLPGSGSTLMLASSNEQADRLSTSARALLVRNGTVDGHGPTVRLRDAAEAARGDVILARRNDRSLTTDDGGWVHNGTLWTIEHVRGDGSADVVRVGSQATVRLPASYLAEQCHLGYASTLHRAQGMTVDVAHVVVDTSCSREGLYVGMTRGRDSNRAWVVRDSGTAWGSDMELPTAESILAAAVRRVPAQRSAHATMAEAAIEVATHDPAKNDERRGTSDLVAGRDRSKIVHSSSRSR